MTAHPDQTKLVDSKMLREEYGLSRAAADQVMRNVRTVKIDGFRKLYAWRTEVDEYLERQSAA